MNNWFADDVDDGTLPRMRTPAAAMVREPSAGTFVEPFDARLRRPAPTQRRLVETLSWSPDFPVVARLDTKKKPGHVSPERDKVLVFAVGTALAFLGTGMEKDLDGARYAYHPPAPGHPDGVGPGLGHDHIRNATSTPKQPLGASTKYVGVLTSDKGQHHPVLRGDGYYTATTSLRYAGYDATDPDHYVDAEEIPYLAINGGLYATGRVDLGDYVAIVETGAAPKVAFGIVADVAPRHSTGECSLAMLRALGHAAEVHGPRFLYLVFPATSGQPRAGRPHAGIMNAPRHAAGGVASEGSRLFQRWGGLARFQAVHPALELLQASAGGTAAPQWPKLLDW